MADERDKMGMRRRRPAIAPDDADEHRALIVSRAALKELARDWYRKGIGSTGQDFHGETRALRAPDMQRMIDIAFEQLWAARRDGD